MTVQSKNPLTPDRLPGAEVLPEDVVLSVRNVSKKFCKNLRRSMAYGIKDLACNLAGIHQDATQLRKDEFWALKDISFDLRRGESLGIIGFNGAGKSTLLRVLNGVFPPDEGTVTSQGRIGALIALGSGMHPHMTGRENIYLNGAILGMTRDEIDSKINNIVDFAEIGDFVDAPLSTYSSGMRVRIGFAVAIHGKPDILLVDEVLAVGDISFRNKALRFMREFRKKASALVYVSHNLEQMRIMCQRLVLLDRGRVVYQGDPEEGLHRYMDMSSRLRVDRDAHNSKRVFVGKTVWAMEDSEAFLLVDYGILDADAMPTNEIGMDEALIVYVDFEVKVEALPLYFLFFINDDKQNQVIVKASNISGQEGMMILSKGTYRLKMKVDHHHLTPGVYYPRITVRNEETFEMYTRFGSGISFAVCTDSHKTAGGVVSVEETWELQPK